MTREKATECLKSMIYTYRLLIEKKVPMDEEDIQALDMAISALSVEPCEDCISRKETLEAIIQRLCIKDESYLLESEKTIYQQIKEMPSVQPIIPNMTIPADDSYMRNVRRDCGLYE